MKKDIKDYLQVEEEWRPIPGYPFYKASSLGRVMSVTKIIKHNYGGTAVKKGKILSLRITEKGYCEAGLTIGGRVRNTRVHKLVALAFIGSPEKGQVINHKDFDKRNNTPENLEWCSQKENVHHAINGGHRNDFGGKPFDLSKAQELAKKKVLLNGKYIFDSVTATAVHLGVKQSTVSQALRRGNKIFKINTVAYAN